MIGLVQCTRSPHGVHTEVTMLFRNRPSFGGRIAMSVFLPIPLLAFTMGAIPPSFALHPVCPTEVWLRPEAVEILKAMVTRFPHLVTVRRSGPPACTFLSALLSLLGLESAYLVMRGRAVEPCLVTLRPCFIVADGCCVVCCQPHPPLTLHRPRS